MQVWQTTFLEMRELLRDISDFEMKAFFRYACKIRANSATSIKFYRGRAVQVGIASGFKSVG